MKSIIHERPGVYSSYDASSLISGVSGRKTVGLVALAAQGETGKAVSLQSLADGIAVFGQDAAGAAGMSTLLKLLFLNGAGTVVAVAVGKDDEGKADYAAAFSLLEEQDQVQLVVCDSAELSVQQALCQHVQKSAESRCERIALLGSKGESVSQLVERAKTLNCERAVLVGPDVLDESGAVLSSVCGAAALAGVIAASTDPAVPLNGVSLKGLSGLSKRLNDNEIDALVQGGVTPLEAVGGVISPVRNVTTRSLTGGEADMTWRELSTILIVDDVIPAIRRGLKSRFVRSKNTPQTRSAVRSQVIVELESKLAAEIIDGYGEVKVSALDGDPTVCLVEFDFSVAHGLNQIYLTAHITV